MAEDKKEPKTSMGILRVISLFRNKKCKQTSRMLKWDCTASLTNKLVKMK